MSSIFCSGPNSDLTTKSNSFEGSISEEVNLSWVDLVLTKAFSHVNLSFYRTVSFFQAIVRIVKALIVANITLQAVFFGQVFRRLFLNNTLVRVCAHAVLDMHVLGLRVAILAAASYATEVGEADSVFSTLGVFQGGQ
jgi:hypothetical protein